MSWIEPGGEHEGRICMAQLQGNRWSDASEIHTSKRLFINWADTPKIAASKDDVLIIWPEMIGKGTYAYGLRYAFSSDMGERWSQPRWLHDDRSPSEHGFPSIQPMDHGFAVVWLDGRHLESHKRMQLMYREVYPSGLGPEQVIDDQTCECCQTALLARHDELWVAYRDRSDDQIRDIYVAAKHDAGWRPGHAIHPDGWEIHGCPVNGPALAGSGSTRGIAWYSGHPQPAVRVAWSCDPEQPLGSVLRIDQGDPIGRVDVAFPSDDRMWVSWLEAVGEEQQVIAAEVDIRSGISAAIKVDGTPTGRVSGFPRMATLDDRTLIAYQNPDQPGIKTVWIDPAQ